MLALVGASLSSCDDFLNDNRYPLANQSNSPEFWSNEVNVQGQINNLYNYFFGYGNTTGRNGTFYFESISDDQVGYWSSGVQFNNWKYLQTPGSNSEWNNDYDRIRNTNYIITNMETSPLQQVVRESFAGEARLVRAWYFYDLVRKFGDVPLVTTVLDPASSELYMGRTPDETGNKQNVCARQQTERMYYHERHQITPPHGGISGPGVGLPPGVL